MFSSGTCRICGCTDHRPCWGGDPRASAGEEAFVKRLVSDENLLPVGEACMWMDKARTICSAHPTDELASYGLAIARRGNGLSEFGLGS
jgi:hypothetical protein